MVNIKITINLASLDSEMPSDTLISPMSYKEELDHAHEDFHNVCIEVMEALEKLKNMLDEEESRRNSSN